MIGKTLSAVLLSALLIALTNKTPANLNNSIGQTGVEAVVSSGDIRNVDADKSSQVQATANEIIAIPQEPSPQPAKPIEPGVQPTAKPVVRSASTVGCDAYTNLLAQYDWDQRIARAVMQAESGCNPNALSSTADRGLMQINAVHAAKVNGDLSALFDPATNIRVAYSVYLSQGWRGWSAYKNGSYLRYL